MNGFPPHKVVMREGQACNSCESNFLSYQSIVVSIVQSGANRLLYLQNQGRNIVLIRRILLCYTTPGGGWGRGFQSQRELRWLR
jgi:hypothetical protein